MPLHECQSLDVAISLRLPMPTTSQMLNDGSPLICARTLSPIFCAVKKF